MVMMCCRKFSCLFDVVTTKSWRKISLPSSAPEPMSLLELRPNGGFARTTLQRSGGAAMRASLCSMSESPFSEVFSLGWGQLRRVACDVCMGGEQESPGATGGVRDPVVDRRLHGVNDGLD